MLGTYTTKQFCKSHWKYVLQYKPEVAHEGSQRDRACDEGSRCVLPRKAVVAAFRPWDAALRSRLCVQDQSVTATKRMLITQPP